VSGHHPWSSSKSRRMVKELEAEADRRSPKGDAIYYHEVLDQIILLLAHPELIGDDGE
jgi:hypothetical protein